MRKGVALTMAGAVLVVGSVFAVACDDDDTIGQNLDQALETTERIGEEIGEEIEEGIDDIGDDETPTPEATETPLAP